MKKTVTVTVCNVCQIVGREVEEYELKRKRDGRVVVVELCAEHAEAAPLEQLFEEAVLPAREPLRLMTMEEIEAEKKAKRRRRS